MVIEPLDHLDSMVHSVLVLRMNKIITNKKVALMHPAEKEYHVWSSL